jgi:hypothetical protein
MSLLQLFSAALKPQKCHLSPFYCLSVLFTKRPKNYLVKKISFYRISKAEKGHSLANNWRQERKTRVSLNLTN